MDGGLASWMNLRRFWVRNWDIGQAPFGWDLNSWLLWGVNGRLPLTTKPPIQATGALKCGFGFQPVKVPVYQRTDTDTDTTIKQYSSTDASFMVLGVSLGYLW